jgi:hypothetical protein
MASTNNSACARCAEKDDHSQSQCHEESKESGLVLLVSKLRCGGVSLSTSLLPPSVVENLAGFAFSMPEHFASAPAERLLYQPPFLAVPAPPPDFANA